MQGASVQWRDVEKNALSEGSSPKRKNPAKSAYLENPIPSLFKERLFVFLVTVLPGPLLHCSPLRISCGLRPFIGRCRGRAANHRAGAQASQGTPAMAAPARSGISRFDGNQDADRLAPPESEAEDWIFAGSALIFVEPTKSERAHQALRQALGGKRLEYLLALLTFIRAAHYWTIVHPGLGVEDAIQAVGASLRYLPKYSPDLNPIELVFHPLKTFLRKAAQRTIEGLNRYVGSYIRTLNPSEAMGYFKHSGYAPL
jgi:transposase